MNLRYLNVLLVIFSNSLAVIAQDKVLEVNICHSYEDLYISYTAPTSCCDILLHGPITIKDSLIISKLTMLLDNSICDPNEQEPNVRFKAIFHYSNRKETLCFGQESVGMLYNNNLFKYNKELCSLIIDVIEKSGAKKPQRVLSPLPSTSCCPSN